MHATIPENHPVSIPPSVLMEDSLIGVPEVESLTGFKKSWIYSSMHAGAFPQAVKLGSATRWSRLEVSQWVKDRLASRALGQPWKR